MENVKSLFRYVALVLLTICLGSAAANAEVVKGVVTDNTGEPLIGVSVVLKGSTTGVVTDIDGAYSINVPNQKNAELVFSYVGMLPKAVKVNGQSTVNVTLYDNNESLEEVVVVGYGQQKKVSVVGAITQTTEIGRAHV